MDYRGLGLGLGLGLVLGAGAWHALGPALRARARGDGGEEGDAEGEEDAYGSGDFYVGGADELPPDIKAEYFSRSVSYFNDEADPAAPDGFGALQGAFVIVVGVGGVGSHAAHMLSRGGVGRMRIVDFDQVTLSSLNRHATAGVADVGRPKVHALAEALAERVPTCAVHVVNKMFTAAAADELLRDWDRPGGAAGLEARPTYVLDCIDDLNTKAELLAACRAKGLRVLASMGAGGKADPTRVRLGEITDCINDPIATKLRWKLRKLDPSPDKKRKDKMTEGMLCVYSVEKTKRGLLPLTEEQKAAPKEFGTVENFRLRVIPVLGTMPAIFGQTMASFVLSVIGLRPYEPSVVEGYSKSLKNKLQSQLTNFERAFHGGDHRAAAAAVNIDHADTDFIAAEIWRGKSPISGVKVTSQLTFAMTRWRRDRPCDPSNILLCTLKEAKELNEGVDGGRAPEDVFGADVARRIDERLAVMAGKNW